MPPDPEPEAVRHALIQAADREAARTWIRRAEFDTVPGLVGVLLDDELFAADGPGEGWAPVYAAELLAEMRPPSALEPMLDRCLHVESGTALADTLHRAVPTFGEAALELLLGRLPELAAEEARISAAYLLGDLATAGHRDARALEFLLETLPAEPDAVAGCLAEYGDPSALPALSRALDELVVENDPSPFANQAAIELVAAIEDLGGALTPAQRAKVEAADRPRRAFVESLQEAMAARTPATGSSRTTGPGRGRGGAAQRSSNRKSKSKSKRKMRARSRRRNR